MRCAAISIALARTIAHALRHELPAITAVPLPPVPRPYAVTALSPCTIVTSSKSMPSSSATTCAIVVSMPWPCEPVPSETVTWPFGLTRTTAVSVPIGSIIPVLGST